MSHSGPSAVAITLSEAERAELLRRTEVPHRRSAEKARIILACAEGMSNAGVARLVGVQAKTVGKWRRAFAAERVAGLEDAGWIGRPKADLILDETERRQLQQWARRAKTAQFLALRARIVLRCAAGGGTAHGARCTPEFAGGPWTALSTGCSGPPRRRRRRRRRRTRPGTSPGLCRSTPRPSGLTSTPPGHEKGQSRTRTLPARTDQQDPPGLRCPGTSARFHCHWWEHQRLHPVHCRDGRDTGAPPRTGTATESARPRPGRQGLQLQSHPGLAQTARCRAHNPGTGRPDPKPAPPRMPRRAPANLR